MDQCVGQDNLVSQQLKHGLELVAELKNILAETVIDGQVEQVDALVEEISGSFTRALSALSSANSVQEDHRGNDKRSVENLESKNLSLSRKREHVNAQKFMSPSPLEDGHFWKKYGQKKILGSKYPRSYFKCSQQKDQGCQAVKQVQKTQDEPPMFQVTYIGQHTCTNAIYTSEMDAGTSSNNTQCMLSFESGEKQSIINQQVNHWSDSKEMYPMSSDVSCHETDTMGITDTKLSIPISDGLVGAAQFPNVDSESLNLAEIDSILHMFEPIPGFDVDENCQDYKQK